MLNLVNLLEQINNMADLCNGLEPILRIVGIVRLGIMIVVPIILIFVGMLDFAKAVGEKDDNKIQEAQKKLVKRAIAAALVFFVTVIVSLIMNLIGNNSYKDCMPCINHPFNCSSNLDTFE